MPNPSLTSTGHKHLSLCLSLSLRRERVHVKLQLHQHTERKCNILSSFAEHLASNLLSWKSSMWNVKQNCRWPPLTFTLTCLIHSLEATCWINTSRAWKWMRKRFEKSWIEYRSNAKLTLWISLWKKLFANSDNLILIRLPGNWIAFTELLL